MFFIAPAIGLFGVLVGLYRPVATIWPLLTVSAAFIPIGYLVAGRPMLDALAAGGVCVISTQVGFFIGLIIRLNFRKYRQRQSARRSGPTSRDE
jgi:hypothetical protein